MSAEVERSEVGTGGAAGARTLRVQDLGRLSYAGGFARQQEEWERVLAERDDPAAPVGTLLFVEHDPPVITVTRRPGAAAHLLASKEALRSMGVEVAETDRGGDITYHGPGQQVVYPIVDLQRLRWNLHRYMRELEDAVMRVCARCGVESMRDPGATGVWTAGPNGVPGAKLCAMGVRVRRWVTMHGLALNVETNLDHFGLIVPCGLAGRPVTSLRALLGEGAPSMDQARAMLAEELRRAVASD